MGGGKTEVSLSENTNEVDITGVNVVTKSPKVGDIVCYDENRKVKFIALDTFHAGTFPAAWETVGVVVLRKGNQVTICSKYNESKKFMEVYPYIVTGYQLDGSEHTAQLRLHGKPSTTTYYEFKYTANSDSEFVTQLKQFLTANGETDWSAYLMDGKVYLQYDNYESPEYYTSAITYAAGLMLTAKVTTDYPAQPVFRMRSDTLGFGIWNARRAKEYFRSDLQFSDYNPSSNVSNVPSYPVCYPAFCGTSQYQEDHCLYLRQRYCKDPNHPTVAEWEKYIDDLTHIIPYSLGGHASKWRDGKVLSDKIKDVEYQATAGIRKKLYSGIDYCSQFFDGKGYMPSVTEFIECFRNVTYGLAGVTRDKADEINRSLFKMGGSSIGSNISRAVMARIYSNTCLVAGGSGGFTLSYLYNSLICIPFARIELPLK